MSDALHTVNDLCEILKLQPDTVRDYLQAGYIRGIKIGGRWRVTEEALEAFIRERYQR